MPHIDHPLHLDFHKIEFGHAVIDFRGLRLHAGVAKLMLIVQVKKFGPCPGSKIQNSKFPVNR